MGCKKKNRRPFALETMAVCLQVVNTN